MPDWSGCNVGAGAVARVRTRERGREPGRKEARVRANMVRSRWGRKKRSRSPHILAGNRELGPGASDSRASPSPNTKDIFSDYHSIQVLLFLREVANRIPRLLLLPRRVLRPRDALGRRPLVDPLEDLLVPPHAATEREELVIRFPSRSRRVETRTCGAQGPSGSPNQSRRTDSGRRDAGDCEGERRVRKREYLERGTKNARVEYSKT